MLRAPRPCGSSSSARWRCSRRSGSPTRTSPRWSRSCGGSTGCRWRSSLPRRASGCSRCRRSASAWIAASRCWSAVRGIARAASRPCAVPSTGASTCSTWANGGSSSGSGSLPAGRGCRPPRPCAGRRRSWAVDVFDGLDLPCRQEPASQPARWISTSLDLPCSRRSASTRWSAWCRRLSPPNSGAGMPRRSRRWPRRPNRT